MQVDDPKTTIYALLISVIVSTIELIILLNMI
jgi:hypothetical protein